MATSLVRQPSQLPQLGVSDKHNFNDPLNNSHKSLKLVNSTPTKMALTLPTPSARWSNSLPQRTQSVNETGKHKPSSQLIQQKSSLSPSTPTSPFTKSLPAASLNKLKERPFIKLSSIVGIKCTVSEELLSKRKKWKQRYSQFQSKNTDTKPAAIKSFLQKVRRKDGLTPLQRFKKAARLVKLLVTVSNVCRDLLVYAIKDEQWYEFCEKFLNDASAGGTQVKKNSFMTTMKNPVTKQLEQLEFDASQFHRDYHFGSTLLTKEIKNILTKRPGTRSQREIEECIYCFKRLVPAFRGYTYEQQKQICQAAMYDRYFQERVILRERLPPDGIYFVLNGTLLESGEKMQQPKVIKPGDTFGEDDLKSGMVRQTNVVSKSAVDLLYLHKFDYEEIFELTVDITGNELQVFDVCKSHLLFNYYPVDRLIQNPAKWQVLRFKYGRLISVNSCETEFIYIIRTGEARVVKCLQTRNINVIQRRRQLQEEMDSNDPFVNKKKLLDFVSDNSLRCMYSFNAFGAENQAAGAVSVKDRVKTISSPHGKHKPGKGNHKIAVSELEPDAYSEEHDDKIQLINAKEDLGIDVVSIAQIAEATRLPQLKKSEKGRAMTAPNPQSQSLLPRRPHTTKPLLRPEEEEPDMYRKRKATINKSVPPFVQVDSLHAGDIFGMRSLLPVDQQGEPAALVSSGCEVIQIHRMFFGKGLDENMLGIIALKTKPYPSEEELLKRLDVNLQWEEYCAGVMCDYLDSKIQPLRGVAGS